MTVQPELDFALGLTPGLPTKGNYYLELEVNPSNCLPLEGKLNSVPKSVSVSTVRRGTNVGKTNRVAFRVSWDERKAFNPLVDLATRRTWFIEGDERYETKRAALVNVARLAVANGVARLPEGYTLDDLNNLKGFRWSPKAGCSMCPCSPAFMSPLLAVQGNWVDAEFELKDGESVATMLDVSVLESLAKDKSLVSA